MVNLEMIKNNPAVKRYMEMGNNFIGTIGAIEHNQEHAKLVSALSYDIIFTLGYPRREAELAAIAGYLHDIGNLVNRYDHGKIGALIVFDLLLEMDMDYEELCAVMGAVANHDEHSGGCPVNNICAAVILADKSDVNYSRVRKRDVSTFTVRDRVNFAVKDSSLSIDAISRVIGMHLKIDTKICSVMDYFEIFITKMMMCRRAAEFLGCTFELTINEVRLL
jgi:metal-dependent HD superfamily phosphatase/phosphodiesterase